MKWAAVLCMLLALGLGSSSPLLLIRNTNNVLDLRKNNSSEEHEITLVLYGHIFCAEEEEIPMKSRHKRFISLDELYSAHGYAESQDMISFARSDSVDVDGMPAFQPQQGGMRRQGNGGHLRSDYAYSSGQSGESQIQQQQYGYMLFPPKTRYPSSPSQPWAASLQPGWQQEPLQWSSGPKPPQASGSAPVQSQFSNLWEAEQPEAIQQPTTWAQPPQQQMGQPSHVQLIGDQQQSHDHQSLASPQQLPASAIQPWIGAPPRSQHQSWMSEPDRQAQAAQHSQPQVHWIHAPETSNPKPNADPWINSPVGQQSGHQQPDQSMQQPNVFQPHHFMPRPNITQVNSVPQQNVPQPHHIPAQQHHAVPQIQVPQPNAVPPQPIMPHHAVPQIQVPQPNAVPPQPIMPHHAVPQIQVPQPNAVPPQPIMPHHAVPQIQVPQPNAVPPQPIMPHHAVPQIQVPQPNAVPPQPIMPHHAVPQIQVTQPNAVPPQPIMPHHAVPQIQVPQPNAVPPQPIMPHHAVPQIHVPQPNAVPPQPMVPQQQFPQLQMPQPNATPPQSMSPSDLHSTTSSEKEEFMSSQGKENSWDTDPFIASGAGLTRAEKENSQKSDKDETPKFAQPIIRKISKRAKRSSETKPLYLKDPVVKKTFKIEAAKDALVTIYQPKPVGSARINEPVGRVKTDKDGYFRIEIPIKEDSAFSQHFIYFCVTHKCTLDGNNLEKDCRYVSYQPAIQPVTDGNEMGGDTSIGKVVVLA